ncbi:MAG: M23 family metallopeptidase [Deltaproteobacteria bacterium]|nr:M23 family metallopeptidase [Deltaproteobacteria bacterium]
MTIRMFSLLFTAVLLGCTGNPSLKGIKAGPGGALFDLNILQFDDAPARAAVPAQDTSTVNAGTGNYNFTVEEVHFRESSFLANGSQAPSVKLLAKNRGHAPVSVIITYDRNLSENMSWDADKLHTSVVPPQTDMVVARFEPINSQAEWKLAWYATWNIGDYTARHAAGEQYRLPFPDDMAGSAKAPENAHATPYTRHAVIFSLPAKAAVLAARNGTVVRIAQDSEVDILHDDSTIATYSHLEGVAPGIRTGKAVRAGEPVGTAGESADRAYLQLAVWRPEQTVADTLDTHDKSVFQAVSFPLEFCTDPQKCRKLKHNQPAASTAAAPAAASQSAAGTKTVEYDFSLTGDHAPAPAYMPDNPNSARIIAVNRGYAPVSVTFDFQPDATENIKPDISLPHSAVIPPQSQVVLARLAPLDARKGMKYGCRYTWQLGDATTRHHCPEHYRFPFSDNVRAFAFVPDPRQSDPLSRYSVQFSLPASSKVLAARSGMVVRVKNNNDIDILHADATIATYSHLGKVAPGVTAGTRVSAGDMLGVAGRSEQQGRAFMQLAVWRPEQLSSEMLVAKGAAPLVQSVSFPLKFCSGVHDCRILTHNQQIAVKSARKTKTEK